MRFHNDMGRCLGAEAVAKVVLKLMAACGIDTTLFKPHSVSATALIAAGIDQTLTTQRGGWSDSRAFDVHYAQLHQLVAWDSCLPSGTTKLSSPQLPLSGVGVECSPLVVAGRGCLDNPKTQEAQSLSVSVVCAKSCIPEPTKEVK